MTADDAVPGQLAGRARDAVTLLFTYLKYDISLALHCALSLPCRAVYSAAFYVDHASVQACLAPFKAAGVSRPEPDELLACARPLHLASSIVLRPTQAQPRVAGPRRVTVCSSGGCLATLAGPEHPSVQQMAAGVTEPALEKEIRLVINRRVGMDLFWQALNDRLAPSMQGPVRTTRSAWLHLARLRSAVAPQLCWCTFAASSA